MEVNLSEETIKTVCKSLFSSKKSLEDSIKTANIYNISEDGKSEMRELLEELKDAYSVFTELKEQIEKQKKYKTLKEFYDSISPEKQISIYNQDYILILNENNVCDCDEIVEKYANSTDYNYKINDGYVDIILNVE